MDLSLSNLSSLIQQPVGPSSPSAGIQGTNNISPFPTNSPSTGQATPTLVFGKSTGEQLRQLAATLAQGDLLRPQTASLLSRFTDSLSLFSNLALERVPALEQVVTELQSFLLKPFTLSKEPIQLNSLEQLASQLADEQYFQNFENSPFLKKLQEIVQVLETAYSGINTKLDEFLKQFANSTRLEELLHAADGLSKQPPVDGLKQNLIVPNLAQSQLTDSSLQKLPAQVYDPTEARLVPYEARKKAPTVKGKDSKLKTLAKKLLFKAKDFLRQIIPLRATTSLD